MRLEEIQVYEIPECNFPSLQAKIEQLNKKAKKLNCSPIIITNHGHIDKKVKIDENGFKKERLVRYYQIIITGDSPIINGWELIAECEAKEKGTLIKCVPGKSYPEKYRSLIICEHCGSDRYRKYTCIVRNVETNEYKMVGKQCLKDFLGHSSPQHYAFIMQWLTDPNLSEFEEFSGGSGEYRIETEYYLSFVAACIRESGWKSKTYVNENGGQSTSNYAIQAIEAQTRPIKDRYGNIIPQPEPNEQDIELAQKAIEWAKGLIDLKNDYLYNINLIAHESSLKYIDFGIAASIISSYKKSLEKEILKEQQKKQKAQSDYTGNIGDKITIELTYVNSFYFDTQWGTSCIHKFIDSNNNIFIWKTNNNLEKIVDNAYISIEQSEQIKLKGTVKEHKEYNNEKQTVLTRCKIL